jgi:hypothetical protein
MTRLEEIRAELKTLYTKSAKAIHPQTIKQYEARISYLEGEAAAETTVGA